MNGKALPGRVLGVPSVAFLLVLTVYTKAQELVDSKVDRIISHKAVT